MLRARTTRVVLAAAHLDHDPSNDQLCNLSSLCQRCHMLHDSSHHLAQRGITYRLRYALGDLFLGPYWRSRRRAGVPRVCPRCERITGPLRDALGQVRT